MTQMPVARHIFWVGDKFWAIAMYIVKWCLFDFGGQRTDFGGSSTTCKPHDMAYH